MTRRDPAELGPEQLAKRIRIMTRTDHTQGGLEGTLYAVEHRIGNPAIKAWSGGIVAYEALTYATFGDETYIVDGWEQVDE